MKQRDVNRSYPEQPYANGTISCKAFLIEATYSVRIVMFSLNLVYDEQHGFPVPDGEEVQHKDAKMALNIYLYVRVSQ